MLRVIAIAAVGLVATVALRKLAGALQPQRVKTPPKRPEPNAITKLRQDPRTGVYYPEE